MAQASKCPNRYYDRVMGGRSLVCVESALGKVGDNFQALLQECVSHQELISTLDDVLILLQQALDSLKCSLFEDAQFRGERL